MKAINTSTKSSGRSSPHSHHAHGNLTSDIELSIPFRQKSSMPAFAVGSTTPNGTTYYPQPSPNRLPLTALQDLYPHQLSASPLHSQYMSYPQTLGVTTPPHPPSYLPPPFGYPSYPLYDYGGDATTHPWYSSEGSQLDGAVYATYVYQQYPHASDFPSLNPRFDLSLHGHRLPKYTPAVNNPRSQAFVFGSLYPSDSRSTNFSSLHLPYVIGTLLEQTSSISQKKIKCPKRFAGSTATAVNFADGIYHSSDPGLQAGPWNFLFQSDLGEGRGGETREGVQQMVLDRIPGFLAKTTSNPSTKEAGSRETDPFRSKFKQDPQERGGKRGRGDGLPGEGQWGPYGNDGDGNGVRKGRGTGHYSRGYGRGNYQNNIQPLHQPERHFNVVPPHPHLQPLPTPQEPPLNEFHGPITQQPLTYISLGYDNYVAPPVVAPLPPFPLPRTSVAFPLDPKRSQLLGQLEYYLSSQNMAQDIFLRHRMDTQGWIAISLLATFNRVRQLTLDIQPVRDVLALSAEVEVQGDWVRMKEWQQFVLPNAAKSSMGQPQGGGAAIPREYDKHGHTSCKTVGGGVEESGGGEDWSEGEDEEDDEEEIVFVM